MFSKLIRQAPVAFSLSRAYATRAASASTATPATRPGTASSSLRLPPRASIMTAPKAMQKFNINKTSAGPPRSWNATSITKINYRFKLSTEAEKELRDCVKDLIHRNVNVNDVQIKPGQLAKLTQDLEGMEQEYLLEGPAFAVMDPISGIDTAEERSLAAFVKTCVMGAPIVQNAEGMRAILVFDRDRNRKMKDGQRYHQSHEGGSIHSDNVNTEELWDYLLLTCLRPAHMGGESILLSTLAVHDYILNHAPQALEVLRQNYLWECRGFDSSTYESPIVMYNDRGEPVVRYLRPYIEAAYRLVGKELTATQIWAMDVLDACCELSEMQLRLTVGPGQTIFMNDLQLLHGRTSFVDPVSTAPVVNPYSATNRLFQRTWVKKD